jgi:hypothetical protein
MSKTPLCRLEWFTGIYERIFKVLSVESRLPDPCGILILPPEPAPEDAARNKSIQGMCWRERGEIWFRRQPPDHIVFAHELLHLIEGKEAELEEVYAYNLSHLAVMLAERGITPPVSIVRLFTDVNKEMVVQALREVYGYPFKDLPEFFGLIGVIPSFLRLDYDPAANSAVLKYAPGYDERVVAIMAVTELIAGAEYDELMFKAVVELLEKLGEAAERRAV